MSHKRAVPQPAAGNPQDQLVHWVRYGDTDKVRGVVKKFEEGVLDWNFDANYVDKHGRSLVMLASKRGFHEILEILVNLKANLEFRDSNDNRAIHYAAMGGHMECAELLIKAGAQLCDENKFGRRVDVLAKKNGHLDLGQLLNDSGCYRDVEVDSEPEPAEVKEGEAPELPALMKLLQKPADSLSLQLNAEAPVPVAGKGEVLVRVHAVALTDKDAEVYRWHKATPEKVKFPFAAGASGAAGVVVAQGEDLPEDAPKVGARVVVENLWFCGSCEYCAGGEPQFCDNQAFLGQGRGTVQGALAGYIAVPHQCVYVVKTPGLDFSKAALLPELGVAQRAVQFLNCPLMPQHLAQHPVLITGANPLGLMVVALAKQAGAAQIVVADEAAGRLELAKKLGATVVIDTSKSCISEQVMALTKNVGVGCWADADGSQLKVGFGLVRRGGRVVLMAETQGTLELANPAEQLVQRNLTIKTVHGRKLWSTWETAEKLLVEGKVVDAEAFISHELPLTKFQDAFALLLMKNPGQVVVEPQF